MLILTKPHEIGNNIIYMWQIVFSKYGHNCISHPKCFPQCDFAKVPINRLGPIYPHFEPGQVLTN